MNIPYRRVSSLGEVAEGPARAKPFRRRPRALPQGRQGNCRDDPDKERNRRNDTGLDVAISTLELDVVDLDLLIRQTIHWKVSLEYLR